MLATLVISGISSFRMGSASIKGVNTPDMNPSKKWLKEKPSHLSNSTVEFTVVPEAKILKEVRVYISQQTEKTKKQEASGKNKDKN
jgi:hypothetical protein